MKFISSVIRQKGESQNRYFKKPKHAKFSGKQTFLTPWYAQVKHPFFLTILNFLTASPISSTFIWIVYLYFWYHILFHFFLLICVLQLDLFLKKYCTLIVGRWIYFLKFSIVCFYLGNTTIFSFISGQLLLAMIFNKFLFSIQYILVFVLV